MSWQIGKRYGNHWTEIVADDGRTVMVRTLEAAREGKKAHETDFEPTEEGAALLTTVMDALNAHEPTP